MARYKITNETILHMLGVVLVEIRADDIPNYAIKMSDVFHNVPAKLIKKIAPEKIYEDMNEVAERNDVAGYLTRLLKHSCEERMSSCEEE